MNEGTNAMWEIVWEQQKAKVLVDKMHSTVVRVISFVVQHQIVINKVERIGARLEGIRNHFVDEISGQGGKFVDVFASVAAVRDAIAKVKVECLQQAVLEEVALNHAELLHIFIANLKFDTAMEKERNEEEVVSLWAAA